MATTLQRSAKATSLPINHHHGATYESGNSTNDGLLGSRLKLDFEAQGSSTINKDVVVKYGKSPMVYLQLIPSDLAN
ncbi:hypothetical protein CCACVL1_04924 [Corchorus capsularis]|uniref:Uncharacterized protein n=1 Tax=Corchorus capsularis TaxID=210143 RepID=A0A1R3JNQ6_COCAP|nr:hypothetical protein CCACVL1_04924 [Corchorus capsularis]